MQSAISEQVFYSAQVHFDERRFFEAHAGFEKLRAGAEGLDAVLLQGLAELSLAFELIIRRRMLDPGRLHLEAAQEALARIPLSEHAELNVRKLKDSLQPWLAYLESLGRGVRRSRPALPKLQ